MLNLIYRFSHGYVLSPILKIFYQRKIFDYILNHPEQTMSEVSRSLQMNEGHFFVALHMFQSLGWLHVDHNNCIKIFCDRWPQPIPDVLFELYQDDIFEMLSSPVAHNTLRQLLEYSQNNLVEYSQQLCDILDGPLIVTLLFLFRDRITEKVTFTELVKEMDVVSADIIRHFLVHKNWLDLESDQFTEVGFFIFQSPLSLGIVASYRPMLRQIDTLLFGDPSSVFTRDQNGHEQHVDRILNVESSSFQHEKYFLNMSVIVESIFNQYPIYEQPKYVVDMGCGDGALLKLVYQVIKEKTVRGTCLDQYPLLMIGVDFNEKALVATTNQLKNIPHLVLQGDISKPQQLIIDLKENGISDPEECLHIRSFLDHEMSYQDPGQDCLTEQLVTGVYVTDAGELISPAKMLQCYIDHFVQWAAAISRHGLIVIEVHSPSATILSQFIDESESLHFNALQAFSGQNLLPADGFLLAAAQAGLLSDSHYFKRFPSVLPFTRITINWFHKQDYVIRPGNAKGHTGIICIRTEIVEFWYFIEYDNDFTLFNSAE